MVVNNTIASIVNFWRYCYFTFSPYFRLLSLSLIKIILHFSVFILSTDVFKMTQRENEMSVAFAFLTFICNR